MLRRAQRQRPLDFGACGTGWTETVTSDAAVGPDGLGPPVRAASWAVGAQAPWVAWQPELDLRYHLPRQQRVLRQLA